MNAAPHPTAAPEQARTMTARSELVQLVDVSGGSVTAPGLHPPKLAGQIEPLEQTRPTHAWFLDVQLSQSDPNCPHAAVSLPSMHCPVVVQQPAQFCGPHDVPA